MTDTIQNILNARTCLFCQAATGDDLLRRAKLLYLGSLREFISPRQDYQQNALAKLQYYFCRNCLSHLPILTYDKFWQSEKMRLQVLSVFSYAPPVNRFIIQLKFYQKTYWAEFLAAFLYVVRQAYFKANAKAVIVPLPLHAERLKERGYNQTALIAAELSKLTGMPYDSDILIRSKKTKRQTEMTGYQQRLTNIKQAFSLNKVHFAQNKNFLQSKSILLLDDVLTTGATLEAAALPFIHHGINVRGITIARDELS